MRLVWVLCACLLAACSTQTVRCERHLTPINVPRRPLAQGAVPRTPEIRSGINDTGKAGGARRLNVVHGSGESKQSRQATIREGAP